jgi:hypothetical protein
MYFTYIQNRILLSVPGVPAGHLFATLLLFRTYYDCDTWPLKKSVKKFRTQGIRCTRTNSCYMVKCMFYMSVAKSLHGHRVKFVFLNRPVLCYQVLSESVVAPRL